jgi:serine protease AprX
MAQPFAIQAPASGLFLMQFEGALEPREREALRSAGIDLLKYVPEDAYITKFNQVSPGTVTALGFVRWVGPYRPEHKIHPRLAAATRAPFQTNQTVAVRVLISPRANAAEIAEVRSLLWSVHHESRLRQGTIFRGDLQPSYLDALAQSSAVLWIERAPRRKLVDELASKLVGGDDARTGTPTVTEQLGYGGTGVTVCVADTGLDTGNTNTMHPDLRGRVTGFRYYGNVTDGSDGYGHGTHCAGIVAGNAATGETDPNTGAFYGLGTASQANLFIERIFDENANEVSPFPSDENLTQDAVRNGAEIGSNSWGSDVNGEYDMDASQFDELVRDADTGSPGDQPYILEFSAGNAGPGSQTMDSPASGKNVIATGASENVAGTLAQTYGLYADGPDTMCDFSSRGPCEDGRLKPDLVAPGSWIASAASSAAPGLASIAWSTIDNYYVYMGGTSMSGPAAAGAAAVFVQYYKNTHTNAMPSPALVKAALINSAGELDESNGGPGPIPNSDEGWGRITLTNIIVANANTAPRYYLYLDQTALLTSGQIYVQHAFVHSSAQPLKVTLAYTDVAGFPGAIPALVNDLDLEVVGPDGTLYRGNQFAAGESVPNPPGADNLNNVEAVHLGQPLTGDYLVRVRARNVVEDARLDTSAIDQDFALVVSGDLARGGAGLILLDRTNYTAPSTVQIEVLDQARASSSTVNVTLKSTTEPAGETYTLHASGNYGAFTGAVTTVVGPATLDGKLEIHNGDSIEADYVDTTGGTRTGLATAQLIPPVLTAVAATNDLGIISILWQTSEPANSIVRYSTNLTFNLAATNTTLTTSHVVKLLHLVPGKTYNFFVSSTDAAGNTATNNNGGSYFSFIAVATPTALFVDDYDSAGEAQAGSTVISDGTYTNALAAAGFNFGFWKVTQRGYPQLADLQGFPVVIWRTTDDIVNYTGTHNTLTPQQQFMIQSYLNGGGSFFMASMGILSQLGNVPFRQNVLEVAGFKTNPDPPAPCSDCDEDFGVPAVLGTPASPITAAMGMALSYSNYPSFDDGFGDVFGPDFSDTFTPATNATPIFFESVSGKPCGMSYPRVGVDSPGRVVFLSFPLDAVPAGGAPPNNEISLLRNVLNFLAPGANGVGTLFLDSSTYTIPDQVTVEVGDSDLAGTGQTSATVSTSSSTNRVTVTLFETTHPGLFRGTMTLVATNAVANQLVVRNGDLITATYFDASNNSNDVATATVDTVPPVITQVSAVTHFRDAVVSWTSSKPADSLVQYGESVLLDRTAYAGALVTNHSVAVNGLSPNRVYFYDVVSRDQAGNTTVNDNQENLYTFQTLRAPQPPWSDNLESGAPNWSVVPDPGGTDINWQLGTPNNGLQTSAHSGTNAWGSNLKGQSFNTASTFLYSPVVDLSGVSQATLTFWDSFDFTSGLEDGQLGISTNSSTPPLSIPTLTNYAGLAAPDWQLETVDLTAFVGQSIQVVWYYTGFQFGSPLNGWLVDDVSITGVAGSGTVVVTKNLAQGTFTLVGPFNQSSGTGLSTTLSNAVPGQYTVQFGDVAFYQTPPSQTNSLAIGGALTFNGNYTFIDVNHNGISDAWENYYFDEVSTNRTQHTDTDGDGMSDYAEFIAGTDPTNAASNLKFLAAILQTNRLVKFQWSAVPGRIYQVQSSTNLQVWAPLTGWLQAQASPMSYATTNSTSGAHLYRVQVRP